MNIRAVTSDDRAQWLPLWQAYLAFYNNPLPQALTDLTFARFLDPAESLSMLVATRDGQMTGFATFLTHRSTWAADSYCYLEDLYVADSMRRRGIARALIEAVAAEAAQRGSSRLYWITHHDNLRARALYDTLAENHGFVTYQRPLASDPWPATPESGRFPIRWTRPRRRPCVRSGLPRHEDFTAWASTSRRHFTSPALNSSNGV